MLAPMRFRPIRHSAAVLAACILAAFLPATEIHAQETADIRLELVSQPVWHDADDRLRLRIRVVNEGPGDLEGFDLVVAAFDKVTTRSGLRTIFESGSVGTIASSQLPLPLAFDQVLGPQESLVVEVEDRVSDLASISAIGEPGVFPIQVTLRDLSASARASLLTPLLYYPDPVSPQLSVVPILPFNDTPARGPAGVFVPEDDDGQERWPLEEALAEDGWITALIDALEDPQDELRMGFAPTPRLLEEIADMADGYERLTGGEVEEVPQSDPLSQAAEEAIVRLRGLIEQSNLQHMLVPYSAPDLPSIAPEPEAVLTQIGVGERVVEEVLGRAALGGREWLFPTAGRVDEFTFEQLVSTNTDLVFSSDSLEAPSNPELAGCPDEAFSFLCAVEVQTAQTASRSGYVLDANLQQRLGALVTPGDDRLDLQQFFAETAMIREELPGRTDRVLAFALPSNWKPGGRMARVLVNGLATGRWLATATPSEGLDAQDTLKERRIESQLDVPPDLPSDPSPATIADARERVEQFREVNPPDELVERLHRDVLVAQSRWWWTDPEKGINYARQAAEKVDSEFDKIRIVGPDEITLTSRTGELQFLIVNGTGYPVTAGVELVSTQLDLDETEPYEISTAQQRLNVPVTTRASGIFRLTVRLVTSDGIPIGDAQQIRVRSTDFNEIALGITFGALAFLILFYAVRGIRRRRRSGTETGTSSA
jgi:Family of unknown function (DUF6049)